MSRAKPQQKRRRETAKSERDFGHPQTDVLIHFEHGKVQHVEVSLPGKVRRAFVRNADDFTHEEIPIRSDRAQAPQGGRERTPAEKYIDAQLEIMRAHGSAPDLSPERYRELVAKVEQATIRLKGWNLK